MTGDGAFDWRPMGPGDAGDWAALLAAIQAVDRSWDYFTEQDLLEEFSDPEMDFARGSLAIYDRGTRIGYAALAARRPRAHQRAGFSVEHTSVAQAKPLPAGE